MSLSILFMGKRKKYFFLKFNWGPDDGTAWNTKLCEAVRVGKLLIQFQRAPECAGHPNQD